jgi:xanthine dehydrogenase small subunit
MSAQIRFVLDGEVRELRGVAPTMTVLQWLREEARRCGTKEGCAEGDCGACTVAIGERHRGAGMRYRAVNSCILFMPMLDGKELVTVESLKHEGRLHPVQRAMVECHGSQCGFCTPGFVMSLFTLYHSAKEPERETVDDVLAGNLCRCTGYRPIIEAAQTMRDHGAPDQFHRRAAATARQLEAIERHDTLALEKDGQRYFAPANLEEFTACFEQYPEAVLVGGATDIGLWVTKLHRRPETLIYTGDVPELRRLEVGNDVIEVGGAVSLGDAFDVLLAEFADFGEILRRFGAVQVRNVGTLGGNIANASPIGDTAPLLLALGATLLLRRNREARLLPLDEFFLAYRKTALRKSEFIEAIRIPRAGSLLKFRAYKISKRFDQDISAVCGAFALRLDGGRIAEIRMGFGGMAAVPKRAAHAETALIGEAWNEASVRAAMRAIERDFEPMTDMRASALYRLKLARNLLLKFFLETSNQPGATRVIRRDMAA